MPKTQRHKLQINYKSGQSMVVTAEQFSIKTNALGARTFGWESMVPNPLTIGVDDIESVWELI